MNKLYRKLTQEQRSEVVRRYHLGIVNRTKSICADFDICPQTLYHIVFGRKKRRRS